MEENYAPTTEGDDIGDVIDNFDEIEDAVGIEEVVTTTKASVPDPALAYLYNQHPETVLDYVEDILVKLSQPKRSAPFLNTFEKTKLLGFRATCISNGARPFIPVPDHISDSLEIAKLELAQRRIPYIFKRPMPDGTFEYWRISDLMIL